MGSHYEMELKHMLIHYSSIIEKGYEQVIHNDSQTELDGRMSRASISHFRRLGDSDLMGLNPGQVNPMTLKLILAISLSGASHYYLRARTGWLCQDIVAEWDIMLWC